MDQALVMVVVGAVIALVVVPFGDRDRLQPSSAVVDAFCLRHGLRSSSAVIVAVDRMLARHRSWRFHGGAFGLLAVGVIASMRTDGFVIGAGVGGRYFPDVLVCVLAGVLGGVVAAESHHLRAPRRSARPTGGTVSLEVRDLSAFVDADRRVARLALCAVGVVLAVVSAGGVDGVGSRVVVWWSVGLMLAVAGVVEWQQRRIVGRARPVMSVDLAEADVVLRREAIGALHHAGNGLVCLLLANAVAASDSEPGDAVATIVGLLLFVGAVVEWRRSRLWIVPAGRIGAIAT